MGSGESAFDALFSNESNIKYNICGWENGEYIEILLPGFERDEIELQSYLGSLIVQGKKEDSENNCSKEGFSIKNEFKLSFNVGSALELVSAKLKNGILTIKFEKVPFNPKKIEIE